MAAVRPAPSSADGTSRDLVFAYFRGSWAGTHQRGAYFGQDRLVRTLLDTPRLDRVVIADAPRRPPAILRDVILRRDPPFPTARHRRHVRLAGVAQTDPRTPRGAELSYRLHGSHLGLSARRTGMRRPAVLTTNLLLAAFGDLRWASQVTLHLTDDWLAEERHVPWRPVYDRAVARIRERGIAVSAVSQTILDRIAPSGPQLLLPNGVEPGEWDAVAPPPTWFAQLPSPRLLYTGGLDRRVEPELLAATAAAVPGASIVLVGYPIDPEHIERLRRVPGVTVRGQLDRSELAATVSASDACLIPHRRTPMTEAMSPIKLYEYLAAGRPVASVDLPPVRGISDRVVVTAPEGFADGVVRALELGPQPEPDRQAVLREFSWAERHARLLDFCGAGGTP